MITVEDLLMAYAIAYDAWLDPEAERKNPTPEYAELIRQAVSFENAKLRELAVGMYGMLEMFDTLLGNHDACETPRPLVFGEDKSFKDTMRELGLVNE